MDASIIDLLSLTLCTCVPLPWGCTGLFNQKWCHITLALLFECRAIDTASLNLQLNLIVLAHNQSYQEWLICNLNVCYNVRLKPKFFVRFISLRLLSIAYTICDINHQHLDYISLEMHFYANQNTLGKLLSQ